MNQNTIYIQELLFGLQNYISNCLLDISTWKSNGHLQINTGQNQLLDITHTKFASTKIFCILVNDKPGFHLIKWKYFGVHLNFPFVSCLTTSLLGNSLRLHSNYIWNLTIAHQLYCDYLALYLSSRLLNNQLTVSLLLPVSYNLSSAQ